MDAMGTVMQQKDSRFEMRLTREQRASIEQAASLSGQSASQWALGHLMDAASRDIREARIIRLSDDAFDAFAAALDDPMPAAAIQLLAQEPDWR